MEFMTGNSIYEVDIGGKQIRRITGKAAPTLRQGIDGEWKKYIEINNLHISECALIVWGITEDGTKQATMTSPIISIESTVEEFKALNNQ